MNPGEAEAVSTQVFFNLLLHQPYAVRKGEQRWDPPLAGCQVMCFI